MMCAPSLNVFDTAMQELLLISGIPGTGKTCFGDRLQREFGFVHYDLERQELLNRFASAPASFITDVKTPGKSVVVTWGFFPNEAQIELVLRLKREGFKLIWFDGDRAAALREFRKRGSVSEQLFHAQIERIETGNLSARIKPVVINSFDEKSQFKSTAQLLEEIRKAS